MSGSFAALYNTSPTTPVDEFDISSPKNLRKPAKLQSVTTDLLVKLLIGIRDVLPMAETTRPGEKENCSAAALPNNGMSNAHKLHVYMFPRNSKRCYLRKPDELEVIVSQF